MLSIYNSAKIITDTMRNKFATRINAGKSILGEVKMKNLKLKEIINIDFDI